MQKKTSLLTPTSLIGATVAVQSERKINSGIGDGGIFHKVNHAAHGVYGGEVHGYGRYDATGNVPHVFSE